jgi:hypothetical protein
MSTQLWISGEDTERVGAHRGETPVLWMRDN